MAIGAASRGEWRPLNYASGGMSGGGAGSDSSDEPSGEDDAFSLMTATASAAISAVERSIPEAEKAIRGAGALKGMATGLNVGTKAMAVANSENPVRETIAQGVGLAIGAGTTLLAAETGPAAPFIGGSADIAATEGMNRMMGNCVCLERQMTSSQISMPTNGNETQAILTAVIGVTRPSASSQNSALNWLKLMFGQ